MKSERPLGLHLTIRKSLVMLGRVLSVCGLEQRTAQKRLGCEGVEVVEEKEEEKVEGNGQKNEREIRPNKEIYLLVVVLLF